LFLKSKQELFKKALILLKTVDKNEHHFHDFAATLKKIKQEVARDLLR
jgi:hypothetical protein